MKPRRRPGTESWAGKQGPSAQGASFSVQGKEVPRHADPRGPASGMPFPGRSASSGGRELRASAYVRPREEATPGQRVDEGPKAGEGAGQRVFHGDRGPVRDGDRVLEWMVAMFAHQCERT